MSASTVPATEHATPSLTSTPASISTGLNGFLLSLFPGAVQGSVQVMLGHPLDTVKTRLQTTTTERLARQNRTFSVMKNIVKDEGALALYRGVTPPLLLTASKRSLQFALWEKLQLTFAGHHPLLPGAITGFAGTIVGCPMHVIKIQTQITKRTEMRNASSTFLNIVKTEGVRGLYRGMYAQIMKDTCFAAVYLTLYGKAREWAKRIPAEPCPCTTPTQQSTDSNNDRARDNNNSNVNSSASSSSKSPSRRLSDKEMKVSLHGGSHSIGLMDYPCVRTFLAGCLASTVTWTLLQPLDTFKTYVQSRRNPREFAAGWGKGSGQQSIRMLWRGLPVSLFRSGPISGVAMIVYEQARSYVGEENQLKL